MNWLTVFTLPDGTMVELPVPAARDAVEPQEYRYRIWRTDGVTEFTTLAEAASDLLGAEIDTSAATPPPTGRTHAGDR
jgi:hypothetical protein